VAALKEALNGTDIEAIKSATEKLINVSQSFSQRLYEEAAKNNGAAAEAPVDDDTIVDAEIVDEQ
jgi:molecular chaperone DnaK